MFKTPFLAFVVVLSVCFLGCHTKKRTEQIKEFEGIVTYAADYIEPNDTTHYNDTIKCYYSHGNILRSHLRANPGKIIKDLYIAEENRRYGLLSIADSLYYFDASVKTDIDKDYKLTASTDHILSHNCQKFTVTATHTRRDIPYHIITEYTFSKGYLPIDKEHFTDCNYDSFNDYTDQCGAFYLGYRFTAYSPDGQVAMGLFYRAISIEEKKLDRSVFTINRSKLIHIQQP